MIPPILHRVVPDRPSAEVERWWDGWGELHPDWEMRTWRDSPDPADFELGDLFERCSAKAQLASLIRYEVLWRFGGIYLDADIEPLRPLDDLRRQPCFFVMADENWIGNAVIGAEPRHPALRACMDAVREVRPFAPGHVGPEMVTPLLREFAMEVSILATRTFYPYPYPASEKARRAEFEPCAETFPNSYGVHHWFFSWAGDGTGIGLRA